MLQPCKDVAPRLCTIVQCNWSRDDECSAAFFFQRSKRSKRVDSSAGRAPRAQSPGKHDPDGNHLPFESQSAQYLFSSSASKELRTAWYLSTSFTDLPVIILLHHHHQHNSSCGLCRLLPNEPLTKKGKCEYGRSAPPSLFFLFLAVERRVCFTTMGWLPFNQPACGLFEVKIPPIRTKRMPCDVWDSKCDADFEAHLLPITTIFSLCVWTPFLRLSLSLSLPLPLPHFLSLFHTRTISVELKVMLWARVITTLIEKKLF